MGAVPVRADRVDGVSRTGRRTARVRDWTSSDGEWAAFVQATGTVEAPALELWPGWMGVGGVGEVRAAGGRGRGSAGGALSETFGRVLAVVRRRIEPRQSLDPDWPRPPGPARLFASPKGARGG
jgi:hypothetical protein